MEKEISAALVQSTSNSYARDAIVATFSLLWRLNLRCLPACFFGRAVSVLPQHRSKKAIAPVQQ
jgi:hypothetical protein